MTIAFAQLFAFIVLSLVFSILLSAFHIGSYQTRMLKMLVGRVETLEGENAAMSKRITTEQKRRAADASAESKQLSRESRELLARSAPPQPINSGYGRP